MNAVVIGCSAFVGTHFLLSHPLRRPMVGAIGERRFAAVYALVAFATIGWLAHAYRAAPAQTPLWAVATVIMLIASVLLIGSLIGNPALAGPASAAKPVPEARGVFGITRHPMMWAFALWGVAQVLVYPDPSNITVAGAIIVLALIGAALQDRKKAALQPDFWPMWERKTSYWPFAAIAAGRARFGGFRPHDWAGGIVVWLAASWAHMPLAGWAAGVWRWL